MGKNVTLDTARENNKQWFGNHVYKFGSIFMLHPAIHSISTGVAEKQVKLASLQLVKTDRCWLGATVSMSMKT